MTNENRARRAMEESEERYRQLATDLQRTLDMSLDLITSFDAEGRFLTASASSTEILGYTPQELIGRPYQELVHPDDREVTAREDDLITGGTPTTAFQNRYFRKNGTVVWLEWAAVVLPGDPNMYCVARDITHRLSSEMRIRELNSGLQHQVRQLNGMRDIDQAISSGMDFSLTLRMILDHLVQV
ncbi:PAS domain S-box protein, partial [Deinococcus malanensis]